MGSELAAAAAPVAFGGASPDRRKLSCLPGKAWKGTGDMWSSIRLPCHFFLVKPRDRTEEARKDCSSGSLVLGLVLCTVRAACAALLHGSNRSEAGGSQFGSPRNDGGNSRSIGANDWPRLVSSLERLVLSC